MRFLPPPAAPRARRAAAGLFATALAVWTWKLLEPDPLPPFLIEFIDWVMVSRYLLAKLLHASMYAGLALLALVAAPSPRVGAWAVAGLVLHGIGTEIGQTYVPNRTGKVIDACIDAVGVCGGVLLWLRYGPRVAPIPEPKGEACGPSDDGN